MCSVDDECEQSPGASRGHTSHVTLHRSCKPPCPCKKRGWKKKKKERRMCNKTKGIQLDAASWDWEFLGQSVPLGGFFFWEFWGPTGPFYDKIYTCDIISCCSAMKRIKVTFYCSLYIWNILIIPFQIMPVKHKTHHVKLELCHHELSRKLKTLNHMVRFQIRADLVLVTLKIWCWLMV